MWLPEGWDYHAFVSSAQAKIVVPAGGDNLARILTDLHWSIMTGNVQNFFPVIQIISNLTVIWQQQVAIVGPGATDGSMNWHGLAALPGEALTVQYDTFQLNTAFMLDIHGYDA